MSEEYRRSLEIFLKEVEILLKKKRVWFDIDEDDIFNPKTIWFIYGCEDAGTPGVGLKTANRLFNELRNDRSGATRICYREPRASWEVHALEYTRNDGLYMKLLLKRNLCGAYIRVVMHEEKENELLENGFRLD